MDYDRRPKVGAEWLSTCPNCRKKREVLPARRASGGNARRSRSMRQSHICRACAEELLKNATPGHHTVSGWDVSDLRDVISSKPEAVTKVGAVEEEEEEHHDFVNEGVCEESDLLSIDPADHWEGYRVGVIEEHYTPKEWANRVDEPTDVRRRDLPKVTTLAAALAEARKNRRFKWRRWLDRSAGLVDGFPLEQKDGSAVLPSCIIERNDGRRLTLSETRYIERVLKISKGNE